MKKWEDTIKERLEGYESTLPEGSYAHFQRLRTDAKAAPRKKVYPLAWAAAVAVAASLAAVLFLRQPKQAEGGVKLVQQQPVEVVLPVADSLAAEEPVVVAPLMAQAAGVKSAQPASRLIVVESDQDEPEAAPAAAASPEATNPEDDKENPVTVLEEPFVPTGSPFLPETRPARKVNIKVAVPVAGGLLGTGALALLAANLTPMVAAGDNSSSVSNPGSAMGHIHDATSSNPNNPGFINQLPVNPPVCEDRLLDVRHSFPLRLGASARIPVWKNLYVTSGLEYSLYTSRFTYSYVGEKTQVAQYLGIPLRLDWVFPLGKHFDAYAGAGMQADFCLSAQWDSEAIERDKPAFSLGAAGGVQLNLTRMVGLFVEPQLSWRIPTGGTVLQTYRTQHPWMFSVSAGVRINLEKESVRRK